MCVYGRSLKTDAATGHRLLEVLFHPGPVYVCTYVCFSLCFLYLLHEEQNTHTMDEKMIMAIVIKEWKRNTTAMEKNLTSTSVPNAHTRWCPWKSQEGVVLEVKGHHYHCSQAYNRVGASVFTLWGGEERLLRVPCLRAAVLASSPPRTFLKNT